MNSYSEADNFLYETCCCLIDILSFKNTGYESVANDDLVSMFKFHKSMVTDRGFTRCRNAYVPGSWCSKTVRCVLCSTRQMLKELTKRKITLFE